jgi:hypothetical protein
MRFKSKVDWWMWVIFWGCAAATLWITYLLFANPHDMELWIGAIAMWGSESLLMLPLFLRTYYILCDDALYIRCWVVKERIPYTRIVSRRETRNPLAAPALSLDRLEIKYRTGKKWTSEIVISPKEKEEFLRLLDEKRRSIHTEESAN